MADKKKEKKLEGDIAKISEIISGEMSLKKREEKLRKMKEEAVKLQKDDKRRKVIEKQVKLEEDDLQPKKVVQNIKLFEWEAPDRYEYSFKDRSFLIIIVLSLVLILFLAILGRYFLMAALISLLFFAYVVFTTKPMIVKNKITARGVEFGEKLYEWLLLDTFFFTNRNGQNFLIIETKLRFPSTLIFLLEESDRLTIFMLLQEFVLYKDVKKQGWLEKMSFGEYIPLEEV